MGDLQGGLFTEKSAPKRKLRKRDGPWILAACFCDQAIEGKDDVISAIRIIDRWTFAAEFAVDLPANVPLDSLSYPRVPFTAALLIMLRDFPDGETHAMTLQAYHPDGTAHRDLQEMVFETGGPLKGANLRIDVNIGFRDSGVYWFVLSYRERELTRIPLEVDVKVSFVRSEHEAPSIDSGVLSQDDEME